MEKFKLHLIEESLSEFINLIMLNLVFIHMCMILVIKETNKRKEKKQQHTNT